jgi:hypothetical protein
MRNRVAVCSVRMVCIAFWFALVGCGHDPGSDLSTPPAGVVPGPSGTEVMTPTMGYPPVPITPVTGTEDVTEGPADPAPGPSPVLSDIVPVVGQLDGGDIVTVHGAHFQLGAEVYWGDLKSPDVFYINDEWLNATTPPGDPGLVDVKVINPDGGEGTLVEAFRYEGELEIHALSPVEGDPKGGTEVFVTGKGFQDGVEVLFGDRLAFEVTVIDGHTLRCLTPSGSLGLVDVRVVLPDDDLAMLAKGYTYTGAPHLSILWPVHGPTTGGTIVQLTGAYFEEDMIVRFGESEATLLSVDADGVQATVHSPLGAPGVVNVTVQTSGGLATVTHGFTYLPAETDTLTLWAVVPAEGSVGGGMDATLVVSGLDPLVPASVLFGEHNAEVTSQTSYPNTVFVTVPPGELGLTTVSVQQGSETTQLDDAFEYVLPLAVTQVSPAFGPSEGGAIVHIFGEGFTNSQSEDLDAFIGALSLINFDVVSDGEIIGVSPPCTPGLVDVRIQVSDQMAVLPQGFECRPDAGGLLALDPPTGSQAGGALVRLIGSGLPIDPDSTTVTFNGVAATEYTWVSPNAAWIRTPRGDVGDVVVALTSPQWGADPVELAGAFAYVDPANKKAAVLGAPIDRTINVTVFDGSTGKRLAGATAILGTDPNTPHQCLTDDRGQCVISDFGLRGKQVITMGKPIYSAYTFADFDGTNVSSFLRPQAPPAYNGPPGSAGAPPPIQWDELTGYISGSVQGLGKYVVPPQGDCGLNGSLDGIQCTPCNEAVACTAPATCVPIGDTGSWCVLPCASDEDCIDGFSCTVLGDGPKCVPTAGPISANCETSRRYFFGSNPDPGTQATVEPGAEEFMMESRLGEVTVYCVGGYTAVQSGQFVPTIMGIREHVFVTKSQITSNIVVPLTIPLSRDLRVRVFGLPTSETTITSPKLTAALDIGAEGWIPFNVNPLKVDGEHWFIPGYPETLAAFPEDSLFTFYTYVRTASSPYLYSYYLNHQFESAGGEPILEYDSVDDRWRRPLHGVLGDLNGVWGSSADHVFAVGPKGRILHKGGFGWGQQPTTTQHDLNAVWGGAPDSVWAVGAGGTLLYFDGISWAKDTTIANVGWDFHDVHGEWIVGDGGILRITDSGVVAMPTLHSKGLRAVHSANGWAVAAGTTGKILLWDGSQWNAHLLELSEGLTTPTLHAAWQSDDGWALVAGDDGLIARITQEGVVTIEPTPALVRDLHVLGTRGDGTHYAAGLAGHVLQRSDTGSGWLDVSSDASDGFDARGLWAEGEHVLMVGAHSVTFGPYMAFVDPVNPTFSKFMNHDSVEWTHLDEGPEATYNSLYLRSADNFRVWTVITDGSIDRVDLPPMNSVIGYNPIVAGMKTMTLYRARNPAFSMDKFFYKDLSMWRRKTWSRAYGTFY